MCASAQRLKRCPEKGQAADLSAAVSVLVLRRAAAPGQADQEEPGHDGKECWSRTAKKGTEKGNCRMAQEEPEAVQQEFLKVRLLYREYLAGTRIVHIICRKKTLSTSCVRGCSSILEFQHLHSSSVTAEKAPDGILASQLKKLPLLFHMIHGTQGLVLCPLPVTDST